VFEPLRDRDVLRQSPSAISSAPSFGRTAPTWIRSFYTAIGRRR